jgi:hypothetical protein
MQARRARDSVSSSTKTTLRVTGGFSRSAQAARARAAKHEAITRRDMAGSFVEAAFSER